MADKKIQWHPGFAAAINLELSANRQDLIYEREYNLNTKPLEIDLLVIKKNTEVQIENEIGAQFRGHNILEYKSPDDRLDIDTFYKASAYACLYKAYGKTVDEIPADDITISIIRDSKPYGLFRYFTSHDIQVTNPYKGIYYIMNAVLFPTQIIVTKELDMDSHMWLKSLSDKLEKHEIKKLLEQIEGLTEFIDKRLADSVLEVTIRANQEIIEELRGDESVCQALLEIMEPEINQIVNERTQKILEEQQQKFLEKQKLLEEQKQKLLEEQKQKQKLLEEQKQKLLEEQEQKQKLLEEQKQKQKFLEEQKQKLLEEQKQKLLEEQKQKLLEEQKQSILRMVVRLRKLGTDNAGIKEILMEDYQLSSEEADVYIS